MFTEYCSETHLGYIIFSLALDLIRQATAAVFFFLLCNVKCLPQLHSLSDGSARLFIINITCLIHINGPSDVATITILLWHSSQTCDDISTGDCIFKTASLRPNATYQILIPHMEQKKCTGGNTAANISKMPSFQWQNNWLTGSKKNVTMLLSHTYD